MKLHVFNNIPLATNRRCLRLLLHLLTSCNAFSNLSSKNKSSAHASYVKTNGENVFLFLFLLAIKRLQQHELERLEKDIFEKKELKSRKMTTLTELSMLVDEKVATLQDAKMVAMLCFLNNITNFYIAGTGKL